MPGRLIYSDEWVYASHAHAGDIGMADADTPQYLGWVTVETRRHIPELGDMNDLEAQRFGWLMARASRAILAATHAEHVYAFVLGHGVPHLHMHLIPRYAGTPREYWGQRVDEWPDAPHGDLGQIADLCERIRSLLGD
jgi:diadenosine tetraphosphate (Ap4A) HIT family hydrolase